MIHLLHLRYQLLRIGRVGEGKADAKIEKQVIEIPFQKIVFKEGSSMKPDAAFDTNDTFILVAKVVFKKPTTRKLKIRGGTINSLKWNWKERDVNKKDAAFVANDTFASMGRFKNLRKRK